SSLALLNHLTTAVIPAVKAPTPVTIHPTGPVKNLNAAPNAYVAVVATACAAVDKLIVPVIAPITRVLSFTAPVCAALATTSAFVAVVEATCAVICALVGIVKAF